MRLSITLILFACVSCVMAQSYSSGTKINEDERKRLENQFKALKTFYINDDGLVVYQIQTGDSNQADLATPNLERTDTSNEEEVAVTTTSNREHNEQSAGTETSSEAPIINRVYETRASDTQRYSETNEPKPERSQSYETTTSTPSRSYDTSVAPNDVKPNRNVVSINKRPVNPIHTQDEPPTSRTERGREVATETSLPKEQEVRLSPVSTSTKEKEVELIVEETKSTISSSNSKKSIFDKNPSKYNNLEEAALAADALLEKLKKEQAQSSGSGSMSSRIARGAGGRSTLRKHALSDSEMMNDQYGNDSYNPASQGTSQSTSNLGDVEDYDIPTYYINGQKVEKVEVDKLRKKDIISREIRTRNTVSGNPAGEIWYEVRENNE